MGLQEFIRTYRGKPVDWDNNGSCQCVDLARQYFNDVWGLARQPEPLGENGNAYWFATKRNERPVQQSLMDFHEYDKTASGGFVPPDGSVVVFGPRVGGGGAGHIAVCVHADEDVISVFEQDGVANEALLRAGKPQNGADMAVWSYQRLLGWLTPKGA